MTNRVDRADNPHDETGPDDKNLQRIDGLILDVDKLLERIDTYSRQRLIQFAGGRLEEMLRSKEDTLRCLAELDSNIRRAAISLLQDHWGLVASDAERCERIALDDPELGVRQDAIIALGAFYAHTKDHRGGYMLASIARDEEQLAALRVVAFFGLLSIEGGWERWARPLGKGTTSLEEIDWNLVEKYYKMQEG